MAFVTGTITNAMLDGIPCTGVGQKGCVNSEVVGHGITTSGIYVQHAIVGTYGGTEMKLWTFSNGNVLNYKADSEGIAKTTIAGQIEGKATNGLFYTNTAAPFNTTYAPDAQFGVTTWGTASPTSINDLMNTTNVCAVRGMRLPRLGETTGSVNPWGGTTYVSPGDSMGSVSGVPPHPSGATWTAASWTSSPSNYWIWYDANTVADGHYTSYYIRCVR